MKTATNRILAALAAVAAVTAMAAPAAAQPYYDDDREDRGRYEQDGRHDGRYGDRWEDARRGDRWEDTRYGDHRGGRGDGYGLNAREAQIERRIEQGVRRGLLTPREVAELEYSLRQFHRSEAAFRTNGLDRRERLELDRQLDWLEARLVGRLNNGAYARR